MDDKQKELIRVLASEITGRCESEGLKEIGLIIKRTIALAKMMDNKVIEYWAHILQSGSGIVGEEKEEEITQYREDWEKALRLDEITKGFGGRAFSHYSSAGLGPETMRYIFEEIAPLPINEMVQERDVFWQQSFQSPDYPVEPIVISRAETYVLYIESVFNAAINKAHDYAASVLSQLGEFPRSRRESKLDGTPKELRFFVYTNLLYWPWSVVKFLYRLLWSFLETRIGKVITTGLGILGALFSIFAGIILIIKLLS